MDEKSAERYGSEKDRINCPFYYKMGACRHGDRCSRIHNKPLISTTILIKNMYQDPAARTSIVDGTSLEYEDDESQAQFEEFFEDIFTELTRFGKIEDLQVCGNLGDHLQGNVYVRFETEDCARVVFQSFNGRYYAGKPLYVEFSPVKEFGEARCRQYDNGECNRGGFCNFMHLKKISRELKKKLWPNGNPNGPATFYPRRKDEKEKTRERERDRKRSPPRESERNRRKSRSRSRDRKRRRSRSRSRSRSRERSKRDRSRSRSRSRERRKDKDQEKKKERDKKDKQKEKEKNSTKEK